MNDKKFTIQLLSNYQQRCFVEFLTEWKKEHEEEYLSFRDDLELLLSGKTFQTKQIRADTSHEVSALLVIFVLAKLKHNHEQR